MDESALERFFDNFIANDSWKVMEEEVKTEVEEEVKTEMEEEVKTEVEEELSSRPADEQQTASSTHQDNSSQNATAAAVELPGGSSSPEPAASLVPPLSPATPQRPEIIPQIQNVNSLMTLSCHLDLNVIAQKSWNVEYNPKRHNAVFMRIRKPQTTALIYRTGKVVCNGAKSVEESRLAARKFARKLQKLGFPVRVLSIRTHNILASCSTFPLSLLSLADLHRSSCSYEPELFSGLLFSMPSGITATIFCSGKLNLTGAKTEAEVYEALETLHPILSSCRRK